MSESEISSFRDYLEGPKAFYTQNDYLETTRQDFLKTTPLPVQYSWTTEKKTKSIAPIILSLGAMLMGACGVIYFKNRVGLALAAWVIGWSTVATIITLFPSSLALEVKLPAKTPEMLGHSKNHAQESREKVPLDGEWKYKRITLEVDGNKIDAMIMGKASTLSQGRWVLSTNMFHEFYEEKVSSDRFKQFLTEVKGNAIVFNYPEVGATPGRSTKETLAKAYRVMLTFLEDQERGVGAKEIIGMSAWTGGSVQGEALNKHSLKKDIKYVFVQQETFSDMATLTSAPKTILRWVEHDWDTAASSKKLQAPEIILQKAHVEQFEELKESSLIANSPGVPAKASLAKALLDDPHCSKENKVFIGFSRKVDPGAYFTFLAQKIETLLSKQA